MRSIFGRKYQLDVKRALNSLSFSLDIQSSHPTIISPTSISCFAVLLFQPYQKLSMLFKGLRQPQLIQDSQVEIFWSPSSTEVLSFLNYSSQLQTSHCMTVSMFHPTCLMALRVHICIRTEKKNASTSLNLV